MQRSLKNARGGEMWNIFSTTATFTLALADATAFLAMLDKGLMQSPNPGLVFWGLFITLLISQHCGDWVLSSVHKKESRSIRIRRCPCFVLCGGVVGWLAITKLISICTQGDNLHMIYLGGMHFEYTKMMRRNSWSKIGTKRSALHPPGTCNCHTL